MSGPIVRSGASPQFSKNWDNIFGKKSKTAVKAAAAAPAPAKKKAAKKTAKKGKK